MFDVSLLNAQTGRYALIAESILPPLFLFIIGGLFLRPKRDQEVSIHGKPNSFAFWLIWFLVVTMWLIALVIVAMDTEDELSLIMIGIFSFLAIFACFIWMMWWKWGHNSDATNQNWYKTNSVFWVLFAFGCMVATSAITFGSETDSDSKVVAGLFFSLIATWLGVATGYHYLGLNPIQTPGRWKKNSL
jgi:hypothetical protein